MTQENRYIIPVFGLKYFLVAQKAEVHDYTTKVGCPVGAYDKITVNSTDAVNHRLFVFFSTWF